MADFLLVVRNRANEKASLIDPNANPYLKGDVIEILPLGISPGLNAVKRTFYSYAKIENSDLDSIEHLKEKFIDQSKLDVNGLTYKMKRKRRYSLPNSVTDILSKDWENPTIIKLSLITLTQKA